MPAAIQSRFAAGGLSAARFSEYLQAVETETGRRVADGEREHFIYYALQSTRFTRRPAIEPAVSALRFVEGLDQQERRRLLEDAGYLPTCGWPPLERARIADALLALNRHSSDDRLSYFRQLLAPAGSPPSVASLYADYVRVVRFLYEKEVASGGSAAEVARLYQTRPHSSDTQIEAGFGVYLGLGVLHALEPERRIRRVLVVGPGLDVAPRTDLIDIVAPQMYQPFAVADALLALSIGSESDLCVESVDVNPRVVRFAEHAAREPPTLHLFSGIADTRERPFSSEYRRYLGTLGSAIGSRVDAPAGIVSDRRYRQSIAVHDAVRRMMSAERLNIVTERLVNQPLFDLVVITNVLTYFDDRQLALALANIAAMLDPGGFLLHNESRAGLVETAAAAQMPTVQMRTAVIARAAPRPLYDTIWLHQKTRT